VPIRATRGKIPSDQKNPERNLAMRILKLMLISIVVFAIFLYLFSLLFPSEIRISRAINIGATKETVQQKIGNLRQWEQWNETVTSSGFTHCVYTDSAFSSDQLQVNLVHSSPDSIRVASGRQNHITYQTFRLLQLTPDTMVVHWYVEVPAKVPWEKFSALILENQLGPPMENALVKLKKMVENNQ
jgi:hypothetical protein